jgi:hypothetical protein
VKKKLLIFAVNPVNSSRLRLDEEIRNIEEVLRPANWRDEFEIITKWAVRTQDLQDYLHEVRPQIVHFAGHGDGSRGLCLENNVGQEQFVNTDALAELFGFFRRTLKCVFLNACYSEVQAKAIHQHIDYVIGMKQEIKDSVAIKFAVGFYSALGAGRSYADAFDLGRNAIRRTENPDAETSDATIPVFLNNRTFAILDKFVRRQGDVVALNSIRTQGDGVTLIIRGIGKTFLLRQMHKEAKDMNKRVAFLDFQSFFDENLMRDEDEFYREFCRQLSKKLDLEEQLGLLDSSSEVWPNEITNLSRCNRYIERYVLPTLELDCNHQLVLSIDQIDMMYDAAYRSPFYGLLRSWHDARGSDTPWKWVNLVLLTEMGLEINGNQSPFSIEGDIQLKDFTVEEVKQLNQQYSSPLEDEQVQELQVLLNGHPLLVSHALSLVVHRRWTFEELIAQAAYNNGPFGEHLDSRWRRIYGKTELEQGLKQVIDNHKCRDPKIARKLAAEWLIRNEGHGHRMRCLLYEVYFQECLNHV